MAAARRIESRADDDARFTMAAPTHCQSPASDAGKACACASDSVYALCVTGTNHESLYPNLKLAEWRRTDSHNHARVAEERSVTIAKCLAVQLDRNATVALVAADVALRSAAKATVTCDRMRGRPCRCGAQRSTGARGIKRKQSRARWAARCVGCVLLASGQERRTESKADPLSSSLDANRLSPTGSRTRHTHEYFSDSPCLLPLGES